MATVLFKKYIYSKDIWFFQKNNFCNADLNLGPSLESWASKILNRLTQLHAFTYTYCKKNTWIIVKKIFCKKNIRSNFSSYIYKEN